MNRQGLLGAAFILPLSVGIFAQSQTMKLSRYSILPALSTYGASDKKAWYRFLTQRGDWLQARPRPKVDLFLKTSRAPECIW